MKLRRRSIGYLFKHIGSIEKEVNTGVFNPDRIEECLMAYTELRKRLNAKSKNL